MKKIINLTLAFLLTFAISMLATSATLAKTPDGLTPNDEKVCDVLKADGTAKGLYGLCVAYCEATDSPADLTTEEKIANLPKPSMKLLSNYNKKRAAAGDVDPQMPCATYYDESACPAWTQDQINSLGSYLNTAGDWYYQYTYDDEGYDSPTYKYLYDYAEGYSATKYYYHYVYIYSYYGQQYGQYYHYFYDYTTGEYIYDWNSVILNDEQYAACEAEIIAHEMPAVTP